MAPAAVTDAPRYLARRLEAGLTQLELARLARVGRDSIRRLERGLPTTEASRAAVEAVLRRFPGAAERIREST